LLPLDGDAPAIRPSSKSSSAQRAMAAGLACGTVRCRVRRVCGGCEVACRTKARPNLVRDAICVGLQEKKRTPRLPQPSLSSYAASVGCVCVSLGCAAAT
jgi:hypothetical protein